MKAIPVVLAITLIAKGVLCCQMVKSSVGKTINIFNNYGLLGDNITADSFCESNLAAFEKSYASVSTDRSHYTAQADIFPNIEAVLGDYYSEYNIDFLPKSNTWKAFVGGWKEMVSEKFGIPSRYINEYYSFGVIRIVGIKKFTRLPLGFVHDTKKTDNVKHFINELETLNAATFNNFIENYGTHYIEYFATGDSLYQIVVYNRTIYQEMKNQKSSKRISDLLTEYFKPQYYEFATNIRSKSGDRVLEQWAQTKYTKSFENGHGSAPFLLPLLSEDFAQWKDKLTKETIVKIHLASLDALFEGNSKESFENILKDRLNQI